MKKLLIVLLSLAFSQAVIAAETCKLPDGRVMVCFEPEKAKELLHIVENENPSLKRQIELLKKEIELQKKLEEYIEKQREIEKEEIEYWKKNYESMLIGLKDKEKELEFKEDISIYTHIGTFILGSLTGGGVMYASSLLISNTLQTEK